MSAPQPLTQAYQPGRPVVALIWDMANDVIWNTVSLAWEAYNPANAAKYQTVLTDPNGIGWYSAAVPTPLLGSTFQVVTYDTANMVNPIGGTEMSPPDTAGATTPTTSPAILTIVNKGLMFLGAGRIASLDEDSEPAQQVAAIYSGVLDATLRSHFWKFATYVDKLALLALPDFDPTNNPGFPAPGWQFLYAYPAQCLKIRRCFDSSFCDPSIAGVGFVSYTYDPSFGVYYDRYKDILFRYKIMMAPSTFQKSIAMHVNPANIEYTYRVTDPTMWDQYFSDAMSLSLAAQLAHPLTGNLDLQSKAMQSFAAVVSEAKRLDSEEEHNQHDRASSYQRSRM